MNVTISTNELPYSINVPPDICDSTVIVLDTETTGLDKISDVPFMCQLAIIEGNVVKHFVLSWDKAIVKWLNTNLPVCKYCVAHNAKYDWHMMRNGGVSPDVLYNTNVYCTQVAEALIDEHKYSYGLDALGSEYFGEGKVVELYEYIGRFLGLPAKKSLMSRVAEFARASTHNWKLVAEYGLQDIVITTKLYYRQVPIIKNQELDRVLALEMSALKALVEVEFRGMPVDIPKVKKIESALMSKQEEIQKAIVDILGWQVNPRSPLQMEKAFISLGLPIKTTKTGKPSFAKDIISSIDHPFLRLLQESRNVKTMLDTFINGSIRKNAQNGRIHTDFNQTKSDDSGTITGRLSSSNPNLQQIPKRDGELAPMIRGLFTAPKGMLLIANDWEQFEFRVFAHYVKDEDLIKRYINDPHTDFHTALAEMTGKPRDKAKRINLGLVFGMGEGKLAKELGLPYETTFAHGKEITVAGPEAKALFDEYHGKFPRAKAFLQEASHIAKSRGYVKTLYGRRLRFPGGDFVHKAGGLVFQGSSADIMKEKLVALNDEFRNTDVLFVLIVHDEFVLLAPEDKAEEVAKRVKEITEDVPALRVPVLASGGIGKNWWDAK